MRRLLRSLASVGFLLGLASGGIVLTSSNAAAKCWTENTDYDGEEGSSKNCLGGNCKKGWCCLICDEVPGT